MPKLNINVECPVIKTFRVKQISGIFDLSLKNKAIEEFSAELPDEKENWQIGVIVGPSGSGKTTIARNAYGSYFHEKGFQWPEDKAVIDGFAESLTIKEITHTLTSVGFSSPPAWIKPYHVLSGGEQFRTLWQISLAPGTFHGPILSHSSRSKQAGTRLLFAISQYP